MSYEGFREYLCVSGHYYAHDCYDTDPTACPSCGAAMRFVHNVDQTNGEIRGAPYTKPAPIKRIGGDDVWHTDKYGTRYATETPRYKPVKHWWELIGGPPQPEGQSVDQSTTEELP